MARAPGDGAMEQELAVRLLHGLAEILEILWIVRVLGVAAHREIDVFHSELLDEGALVERDARRHLRRSAESDDCLHALGSEIAQSLLCWLTQPTEQGLNGLAARA